LTLSFRPNYGPEVDSVANRNEYQEYHVFARRQRLPVRRAENFMCKSESFNFLEPSGQSEVCCGDILN